MTRIKLVTAVTAASLFAASFSTLPTATAVQFHGEERSGKPICVSTSTAAEVQVTRDYFQAQMDQYEILQTELREAHPQFAQHYKDFDQWIAQGLKTNHSNFYTGLKAIEAETGFTLYEANFFAVKGADVFTGTDRLRGLEEMVETGVSLDMEFAPNWSKTQMADYPESDVPVVAVGADWSLAEVSSNSLDAYVELYNDLPRGALVVSESSVPNMGAFLEPRKNALKESRERYEAVFSPTAIYQAAQNCHTLYLTGVLPPAGPVDTTTVTPTTTVTAPPVTVTATPEPVTTTASPETVVETPAPVTTTAAPVTTTVTAPTATVTATPEPVTTTASPETVVETPAPVTTTAAPVTTTVTAPVATVTETPAPVTTTAAPVTTTVTAPTATVTEAPVTTTVTAPVTTVTETPAPVTTTVAAPTVTKSPDESTGSQGGGNNVGLLAAIIAVLTALGGVAVFMANNLGLLQGFF